ncbi:MAG: hypothetical protein NC191_09180, partial [Muribaculaceae bacterium]|nr:hypothetical protein [Muribaculaceae bacterium]
IILLQKGDVMFKKLAKQLKEERAVNAYGNMTSPIPSIKNTLQISNLKNLSRHALNLYERKTDINNFTRLVLSNPENESHNEIVDKLFADKTLPDVFSDEAMFELSENSRFLEDLGL